MAPEVAPVALAQPEPVTIPVPVLTATERAVAADDVPAFRAARQAERLGTPAPAPAAVVEPTPALPIVAAPAVVAAPVVEEPRVISKRQQQINDYERKIAEQAAELARLKAPQSVAPRAVEPPAALEPPPAFPTYEVYLQTHPEATLEVWLDARDDWRDTQRETRTREATAREQFQSDHQRRVTDFRTRMDAASAADEKFYDKLNPALLTLEPRETVIADGHSPAVENDLATEILQSTIGPQVLLHLTDHPEDLARLRACATRGELLRLFGRIEERIERGPTPPLTLVTKTVSDAPPPPTTLGRQPAVTADPIRAAVIADDVSAFRKARLEERLAGQRR